MNNIPDHPGVAHPVAKVFAAWAGVGTAEILRSLGITTWGDAAAAAAFCYSLVLLIEWGYKRVFVPLLEWWRVRKGRT